jgi:general secretion pathway protein E
MGIPRENLATGLNLILAQTLVKKLCERCKIADTRPSEAYEKVIYKATGCPDCFFKGTRGRTAMAELLYFNDEVKEWIQDRNLSARDVVQRAISEGYLIPIKTVAREKVLAGITSEIEVAAVLGLVESKRQFSNRSYAEAEKAVSESMQETISHHDDIIEGEIVG